MDSSSENSLTIEFMQAMNRLKNSMRPRQNPLYTDLYADLSSPEIHILFHMREFCVKKAEMEIPMQELHKQFDISKPALTQQINKLEDKGYIERIVHKDDRRSTFLQITPKGNDVFDQRKKIIAEKLDEFIKEMGEEDTKKLIELVNKLYEINLKQKSNEEKET
ncbi:MAG: MarR family transcriptional regulator [Bacillota bacterium]|nr:MarR family transcriptional regulator [Bacillota bacterium]